VGVMVDSGVFIYFERQSLPIALPSPLEQEGMYISAVTVSELYLGLHRADTEDRRQRRAAFVTRVMAASSVLDFTAAVAQRHAEIGAGLRKIGRMIGAHDLIIAATAVHHDLPLLTGNIGEFSRVPGLRVVPFVV
jgi:tRNA(fMet)-specific endonuclease VapC